MKKKIANIALWLLLISFSVGGVFGLASLDVYRKNQVINNPPNTTEIEEMLESDLLDKNIQIDKIVEEHNILIVYVRANGLYYKCVLKVKSGSLFSSYWDCTQVVQVSEEYYLEQIH